MFPLRKFIMSSAEFPSLQVGLYVNRVPVPAPSLFYPMQQPPFLARSIYPMKAAFFASLIFCLVQTYPAFMRSSMQPPPPPNYMIGGQYWPPMSAMVPNDGRGFYYIGQVLGCIFQFWLGFTSVYDPDRPPFPVRAENFTSPVRSLFVNESKVDEDSWSLEEPRPPSSEYSCIFCGLVAM